MSQVLIQGHNVKNCYISVTYTRQDGSTYSTEPDVGDIWIMRSSPNFRRLVVEISEEGELTVTREPR